MDTAEHITKMKNLMKIREVRAMNLEVLRLTPRQLKDALRDKQLSTQGDIGTRQDRLLRASLREAGLQPGDVPWYTVDTSEETHRGQESTSEEERAEQQKIKKRRGRKPRATPERTDESAATTDESGKLHANLNRLQINEIVGVGEPVTSTSGLSARTTPTVSYSTATLPTSGLYTASETTTAGTRPVPVTTMARGEELNNVQGLPHFRSIAPELQQYWTSKARQWQMSTLGVQYMSAITTPRQGIATEVSPGHGVSLTQPSPLMQPPWAAVTTPHVAASSEQPPAAPPAQTSPSIHEDLYADGWKNGEGTSSEEEEVDGDASEQLTQIATRLATTEPREGLNCEAKDVHAPTKAVHQQRNMPQWRSVVPPRRLIQDEVKRRSQARANPPRRARGSELEERETDTRSSKQPQPVPWIGGRQTSESSENDSGCERVESLRRRERERTKPREGRSHTEEEGELGRMERPPRRAHKLHHAKSHDRTEGRRNRRKRSQGNRRRRRRRRSPSESSSSSGSSEDDSTYSSGSSSEEDSRKTRSSRRDASREWTCRREVQTWTIKFSGEDRKGPEEFLTMLSASRKKMSAVDKHRLRARPSRGGACYTCERIGHRASQCPRRECYACHQVGHIASDCPLRPPRPSPNVSCQVCGQQGVMFVNCPSCVHRRMQWGNGQVRSQNNALALSLHHAQGQ